MHRITKLLALGSLLFASALADPPPPAPPATTPTGGTPTRAELNAKANKPLGPFASDIAAAAGGVAFDEIYRKSDGSIAWLRKPVIATVAVLGDSITEQNSNGLDRLNGYGYATCARMFSGSKYDFEPNGSVLEFATGGMKSAAVLATHLPQVLASGADAAIILAGTNDVAGSPVEPASVTVANLEAMVDQLRAAGIWPIVCEIPPIGLALSGGSNSAGVVSSRVVVTNAAVKAAMTARRVPFVEYNALLETTPGTGILKPGMSSDSLHPDRPMAMIMGRALNAAMANYFAYSYDPLANVAWENANVAFAGTSGQPTGWAAPFMPTGATLNSKTIVEAGTYDWWELNVTTSALSGDMSFNNGGTANLGGSPVGKNMEFVLEVQVVSGAFQVTLTKQVSGGSGIAYDVSTSGPSPWADIIPADGIVMLRTPATLTGSGATAVWPNVGFKCNGNGIIRFRRCGVRIK